MKQQTIPLSVWRSRRRSSNSSPAQGEVAVEQKWQYIMQRRWVVPQILRVGRKGSKRSLQWEGDPKAECPRRGADGNSNEVSESQQPQGQQRRSRDQDGKTPREHSRGDQTRIQQELRPPPKHWARWMTSQPAADRAKCLGRIMLRPDTPAPYQNDTQVSPWSLQKLWGRLPCRLP